VDSIELRRLAPADLARLQAEVDRARAAGEFRGSSDPEAAFFVRMAGREPGAIGVAVEADGALAGFISPEFKVVVVRPDRRRRGIGRALVELGADIERERGRPNVLLGVLPADTVALAFLGATGFAYHSTVWDLDLPPDAVVVPAAWPAGHLARPFDRSSDVERWVALFNAAFADHATPLQLDPALIAADLDDPAIEDADTLLVEEVESQELIGFCATAPDRVEGEVRPHGEIWAIGVRPDRQGRGLGRQLLRWGVARLRSLGVRDVRLSVNGRNEHALGLYESEGFARRRTRDRWARPVVAAGRPAPA
jgi:mycothiol synthase